MVKILKKEYFQTYNENPNIEQVNAWKSSLNFLKETNRLTSKEYPIIVEYPIFNLERADFIILGKRKGIIIETKGWKNVKKIIIILL